MLSSAWDGVSELFNATVRNTQTQSNEALTHNTNDYEVIMTDAGYARKYADGRYEYIDEVTARAEMYKQTYGGEVVETKANGNKGLNPDKIRDMRELQDDGSYKVTIYDDNGNVVQQYYEVKKLDTSKALGYEDGMRLSGGDKDLSKEEIMRIGMVYGAVIDVNTMFNEITKVADILKLEEAERLKYVVDNLMDEYAGRKFYDETHLAYTYAALMENIAREFSYNGQNGIRYGFTEDVYNDYPGDGYMNKTRNLDCANFAVIGLNILGLVDYKGQDANLYYPGSYNYDQERENAPKKQVYDSNGKLLYGYTNAVTNLRYETSLFTAIEASRAKNVDLTGALGVMKKPDSYYDHVYVSMNKDGSRIVDSNSVGGIMVPWQINKEYKKRTTDYLILKLTEYRRKLK